jgi:hypothetical protein
MITEREVKEVGVIVLLSSGLGRTQSRQSRYQTVFPLSQMGKNGNGTNKLF